MTTTTTTKGDPSKVRFLTAEEVCKLKNGHAISPWSTRDPWYAPRTVEGHQIWIDKGWRFLDETLAPTDDDIRAFVALHTKDGKYVPPPMPEAAPEPSGETGELPAAEAPASGSAIPNNSIPAPLVKDEAGKLDYTEGPLWGAAIDAYAQVVAAGRRKYPDPDNWRKVEPRKYLKAAFRHMRALLRGERIDPTDNQPHDAKLLFNIAAFISTDRALVEKALEVTP